MTALFGTDGMRGVANKYPMDCETALRLGRAVAEYFGGHADRESSGVLIGCDTRISNHMITSAFASGICSMGLDVVFAGVLPTPGVAYLTAKGNFCVGVVVSASHNKFCDNGIKLFDRKGHKLSNFVEAVLERMIEDPKVQNKSQKVQNVGQFSVRTSSIEEYNNFLENSYLDPLLIKGARIVLDCSNGSTSICAPSLFEKLGADVTTIFCSPNGTNINDNCGSEHPETLVKVVLDKKADVGFAFDGDGDRLTAVSEIGEILTGDQLLAIFANDLKKNNFLSNDILVSTVMSNFGLSNILRKLGIKHVKSHVGDRCVAEAMTRVGAVLGGETSGHIIFANHQNAGDAVFAALKMVGIIKGSGHSLSKLSNIITLLPQCLMSIEASSELDLSVDIVQNAISTVEDRLGDTGRVLVRYSGTQPKCRIMVEGNELGKVKRYCKYISEVISEYLGSG